MADQKVSDLPSLNGADVDPADLLYIIDSSAGSAGSKKITVGQYQLAPVSAGTANGVAYLNASKALTTGSALVFDGTNLGIGTSSPTQKLTVSGNGVVSGSFTVGQAGIGDSVFQVYTASYGGMRIGYNSTAVNYIDSGELYFRNAAGSATLATLNSSGNLGLGVTPSAWAANYRVLQQAQGGGALVTRTDSVQTHLSSNWYYDGTDKYYAAGAASRYTQISGQHQWWNAVAGPVNGTITTFTQAMTLDASGNLGVGTTSVPQRLTVEGSAQINSSGTFYLNNSDNSNQYYWQNIGATGANNATLILSRTNAGETLRITSGGDLLVGTTSNTPANTTAVAFCAGSTAGYGSTWQQIPNNAPASYKAFTVFRGNVEIGSISYNGTGVNFNATSDRRLKENIAPAGNAGAVIDAIDIVQHDWKAGGHTRFGVIAQDLNKVAPEAVTAGDDNEEIERTWGVDYSKLVPMLIKEIQTLRARVAALEA